MTTFKVPCPSCEAKVLIKNPNLIGTKVECPKCKYRFKVEAPKDESAVEPTSTPAPSSANTAKKAKKKKMMIGVGLGLVAVCLLGAGGFVIFGGDDKKPTAKGGSSGYTPPPSTIGGPDDPNKAKEDDKDKDKKPAKKLSNLPYSDKDPTNLLPNQSVAVYRYEIERLRITPLGQPVFDRAMMDLFRNSTGLDVMNVEKYFHCVVGEKERAPFGLICLKEPVEAKDIKIAGAGKAKAVNGKNLMPVAGNPFFTAIGQSMSGRSLLADAYEQPVNLAAAARPKESPLGVCIYDTQLVFVGDYAVLEKYLQGLKNGYPEYLTVWKKETPPAPTTPDPKASAPMSGTGTGVLPPPGTPPAGPPPPTAPPAGTPPAAPPANKDFTSNPSYLSVPTDIKKMLNALEDEPAGPPNIVMAEKFDNEVWSRKNVKKAYAPLVKMIDPVLNRTSYIGLNLAHFTPRNFTMTIRILGKSTEEARSIALDSLTPTLTDGVPLLSLMLDTHITLRNYADPNAQPQEGPGGTGPAAPPPPGGVGPGAPPPPGRGGGGAPPPLPPPGGPGPGGPGKTGSSAGGPPPGIGSSAGGPPPGLAGGPPMLNGAGTGGPGLVGPGTVGPGLPGPIGPGQTPTPVQEQPSYVDLRLVDMAVTIHVTINWNDEVFNGLVYPRLFGLANQLKGKTTVYAGSRSWIGLAQAVEKYVDQNKRFPTGTIPRPPTDPSRLGLNHPPIQRLSLFVELLPYVGRANLMDGMNKADGWFDGSNIAAAEAWVPEFLVPYYDQAAWRAHSPLAPDRVLGGTNFVAIAGVGPDAARYSATNPHQQKLMGISGYDWGSKVEEVTDGLANTIFLMQVPPSSARPWAAGGGATVVGLDPKDPMADFKYQRLDGDWGTFAIMGDGAVRWIPATIKPEDLLALATRAGGEKLSAPLEKIAPRVDRTIEPELKAEPKAQAKSEEKPADPKSPKPVSTVQAAPAPRSKQ